MFLIASLLRCFLYHPKALRIIFRHQQGEVGDRPRPDFLGALGTLQDSNYSGSMSNISKPGCLAKCGDVTVPYPFGIGEDCSLNDWFHLTCKKSSDSNKTQQLFINYGGTSEFRITGQSYGYYSRKLRIHSISDSELRIFNSASVLCYQQEGNISFGSNWSIAVSNGLFTLSEKNKFTLIGCADRGLITGEIEENALTSSCSGWCKKAMKVPDGQCSGIGCCQTSIYKGLTSYDVTIESVGSRKYLWDSNKCTYAFVGEGRSFEFRGISDLFDNASEVVERIESTVPVVIDWVIATDRNCSQATECKDNSHCYDVDGGGYRCRCNKGYEGNPYIERGCQANPECPAKCGGVTVPYPFGIREDCSLNDWFHLTCKESSDSDKTPQLFINYGGASEFRITGQSYGYYSRELRIHSISDSELRIFNSASVICYQPDGNISFGSNWSIAVSDGLFTLSEKNKFTHIGCADRGLIAGVVEENAFNSSCSGWCNKAMEVPGGQCPGSGCCQTSITKGLTFYDVTIERVGSRKYLWDSNKCSYAFVGEGGSFEFHGISDLFDNALEVVERIESTVPVVIDWVIATDRNCSQATECKENSECYDVEGGGYRCRCNKGYEGNPYLKPGCQGCEKVANKRSKKFTIIFILGVLLGTVILILAIWMYKVVQKRKDKKRREKFFKKNGGLLLQQQILNGEDAVERTRMFSARELEKATDQYNTNRIVGRGGQGNVYKGMLPDGKIVAVKKSVLVDETQVESFINEVFLLSQISHRNVVKLLGCCLETEVPVLVYEFVSNGDLFQFIHDENYEFPTLWSIRISIATEVAGALAYMHSATSIPIYHRDIKSSNILLDEKFRAKLSDFGISKSIVGDQTHLSTLVKGTHGYLDPEYFQSNQFTEKSDVYSFGIVLVELLTGKKPIYSVGPGESRSLATLILSMKEGLILENIDDRVSDGPKEQLIAVAKLAKRCLNLNGKLRPSMKEVAIELEGIRSSSN